MFTDVKEKLRDLGTSPIFFIGSGLSRRYISSPDWIGLLEKTMEDIEINFSKHRQKHTSRNTNLNIDEINMEELSQELEDVFFEKMQEEYLEDTGNKAYYYRKQICKVISQYFEDNKEAMLENEEVIELKKTSPSAIITTNYDEMIEEIFGEEYTTHIGQTSLLTSVVDGVGDIYKIHGSVKEPNSIVVTREDYNNFFEKEMYLNAKLLTLFLEYPIIFLGYSISDRNVKSILTTIVKMLPPEKVEELKKRIWFIKRSKDGNDKVDTERITLENGLYIDIKSYSLKNYVDFYKAINDVSIKKLPIRFLKYLKNNIYDLVASQEYNSRLIDVNINEIESINNFNEGNNFVGLTFSTKTKDVVMNKSDICKAFLDDDKTYEPYSILKFKVGSNIIIPFYKFIFELNANEIINYLDEIDAKESKFYNLIKDNTRDYIKPLGVIMDLNDFNKNINIDDIKEYINEYMKKDGVLFNQRRTVTKNLMLYLLETDLIKLSNKLDVCKEYSKELGIAITNLPDIYVRENFDYIKKIVKIIIKDDFNDPNNRNLLSFIDKVIYRNQIEGIELINTI